MKIGLIPSFFFNFSQEACDTRPLLRQSKETPSKSVAKLGKTGEKFAQSTLFSENSCTFAFEFKLINE